MTSRPHRASRPPKLLSRLPWALAFAAFLFILYRTAWVSDDAFITLRVVDNFWHGYGLRWNVAERVQVFTHPLWMLVLLAVYGVTREPFYTTMGLGVLVSLGAFTLLARQSQRRDALAPLLLGTLAFSRGFVDFSTSGLENPLSHLLAAAFCGVVLPSYQANDPRRRFLMASLLAGLAALTREDQALLYAPALVWLALRSEVGRRSSLKYLSLAALPVIAWSAFSLVYYGQVLPNTASAKLNVQIPRLELSERGLEYLADFAVHDPLSAALMLAAMLVTIRLGRPLPRALLGGILLYLAYVVSIGGDFMSGRFLTTPVLVSVALLISSTPHVGRLTLGAAALASAVLAFAPPHPLWVVRGERTDAQELWSGSGIIDERQYYFAKASLYYDTPARPLRPWHEGALDGAALRGRGTQVYERGAVGFVGYFAGPAAHIIDFWALCDPLLARIPFRPKSHWRMGHFTRKRPGGYAEAAAAGDATLIPQPLLARLYADVLQVTRAPLFSPVRWSAILRLNTGYYDSELTRLRY